MKPLTLFLRDGFLCGMALGYATRPPDGALHQSGATGEQDRGEVRSAARAAASFSRRCPKSKAADKSAVKQFTIAVIQCVSCLRCSKSKPTWVVVECGCCGGCHFIHLHFASLAVRGADYSQTKVKFYVLAILLRPAIIHALLYPLQIN